MPLRFRVFDSERPAKYNGATPNTIIKTCATKETLRRRAASMGCRRKRRFPRGAMRIIASTMEFVLSNLPGRSRMRLRIAFYFFVIVAILPVSITVFAHHGNAAYETGKAVELKGAT